MTFKEFEDRANNKHNFKFKYTGEYINNKTNSIIATCKDCGYEFPVRPDNHLNVGTGCKMCSRKKISQKISYTLGEFLDKAKKKHCDKNNEPIYDYSLVTEYNGANEKYQYICHEKDPITGEEHGIFEQTATRHLYGDKCPKCTGPYMDQDLFIKRSTVIHKGIYDYSQVIFESTKKEVIIIDPVYGEFKMKPNSHLNGQGHQKRYDARRGDKTRKSLAQLKEDIVKVHGNKYDLSKIVYKNRYTEIVLSCKEIDPITDEEHGDFKIKPNKLIHRGQGCDKCRESTLERQIRVLLELNNINYIKQHKFDWLKNPNTKCKLSLDFYLPDYNIVIEGQGEQHFAIRDYCYSKKHLNIDVIERDIIKYNLVKDNGLKMLYIIADKIYKNDIINCDIYQNIYSLENSYYMNEIKESPISILNKKTTTS
jgi:hypothetical protein